MKNPYEVLGIKKDATAEDIKKSYRKLAHQHHPDKNPDDPKSEEKFKEVSAAYEILSDEEKRQRFDTYGDSQQPQQGFNPFHGFDFGDFFPGRQRRTRGDDIKKSIRIEFMEAVKGCVKKISIDYPNECIPCKSNGSKDGKSLKQCETCGGAGKIGYNQGMMQILQTCSGCGGRGNHIIEKCTDCSGTGNKIKNEVLKITIPAGIDSGMSIRLTGKGMASPYGAEAGDLYLSVSVVSHEKFKRNRLDIYSEESINYLDAILGTKISTDTIHGPITLTIPPGTQPETILRIQNKGIDSNQDKGSHLVNIKVSLPREISDEEREYLEKLRTKKV